MLMKVKVSEVGTLVYLQKHQINNVIRLFEIIDLEDKLILVMDYCDDGDLQTKIKNQTKVKNTQGRTVYFTEDEVLNWFT